MEMTSLPKNNLKERMSKLGYNPNLVVLTIPELDNSKVIKREKKVYIPPAQSANLANQPSDFKPPVIMNIDEWSDFEDE